MSVTNQGWYDKNAGRHYPLDELASCRDDEGTTVPTHLLIDARLHFPRSLGEYAFLGGLTLTDKLVSIVILAADAPDSASTYVPLAALTLPRTAVAGRMYAVTPMATGVAGWVVFGPALRDALNYRGRFTSPAQSRLLRRVCRDYRDMPIPSVGKLGNNASLTGLVRLRGGADIEVVGECREITGFSSSSDTTRCDDAGAVRCIVVRLKNDPRESQNLLAKYVGPCGRRPESGTCADPQPVETISGVGPDADGIVTIEFRGAAALAEIVEEVVLDDTGEVVSSAEAVGVLVDSPLALTETCGTAAALPSRDGRLPSELEELCVVSSIVLPEESIPGDCDPPRLRIAPRFDVTEFTTYRSELAPVRSYFEGSATPYDWALTGSWAVNAWDDGALNPFAREPAVNARTLASTSYDAISAVYAVPTIPHYRKFSTVCYVVGNARLMFGIGDAGDYHYCELYFDGGPSHQGLPDGYTAGCIYGYRDTDGVDHVLRHTPLAEAPFVAGSLVRLTASIWPDPDEDDESQRRFFCYTTVELLKDSTTILERHTAGQASLVVGKGGEMHCLSPESLAAGVATAYPDTVFYEFAIDAVEYPGV